MPYEVIEFRETPNPNAIKCVINGRITPAPRSYQRPEQAAGDDLALALFAIPGVVNLLIHEDWLTVGKTADAAWGPIKAAVRAALRAAD